jgi:hypothetical protein
VKIALLDSGIKLSEEDIDLYASAQPPMKYRSWIDEEEDGTWNDSVGHGTHLAVVLRRIAPQAIVHVGRVFESNPQDSSLDVIAQVRKPICHCV